MTYIIYGFALIGGFVITEAIVKHIKYKIGIYKYYKNKK